MLPEEEPEQQLLEVTAAQIAEHQASRKIATAKAASSGATGCLGGFAAAGAAGAGASKAVSSDRKKKALDAATHLSKGADSSAVAAANLAHPETRKLQTEKQQLLGKQCEALDARPANDCCI